MLQACCSQFEHGSVVSGGSMGSGPCSFQSPFPVLLHDKCSPCTGIRHMGRKCFQICLASVMGCNWGRLEKLIFNVAQHFALLVVLFLQEEMKTIEGNGGSYRCIFTLPLVNEVFSVSHVSNCLIVCNHVCLPGSISRSNSNSSLCLPRVNRGLLYFTRWWHFLVPCTVKLLCPGYVCSLNGLTSRRF